MNKKDMKLQAMVATLYENCGFYTNDAMGAANFGWLDSGE